MLSHPLKTALLLAMTVGCTQYVDVGAESEGAMARGADTLRIVSWNIETIGDVESAEYDAALQILARLDADVVALQEVEWSTDEHSLYPFAAAAGYPHVVSGWPVSYGDDTQVILSRFPITSSSLNNGPDLSGDPWANDLTRSIPVATIDLGEQQLVLGTTHNKASNDTDDQFRRTVDAMRGLQALGSFDPATDLVVFCGDINDDIEDGAESPAHWNYAPSLSSFYVLGNDLQTLLDGPGFPNGAFWPFTDAGMVVVDGGQLDGSDITRPESGRRLDYFFVTPALADGAQLEVYDTNDEWRSGGLPKAGSEPTIDTLDAADHLPVIIDLIVNVDTGTTGTTTGTTTTGTTTTDPGDTVPVTELGYGDLLITEAMANPYPCGDSDGEWVEVLNTTADAVDLRGLELCDAVSCTAVDGVGVLEAGEVAVFARTEDACGLAVDGTFGRPLNNNGDDIVLRAAGLDLHAVSYTKASANVARTFDANGSCTELEGTPGLALDCDGNEMGGTDPQPTLTSVDAVPDGVLLLSELMPNPSGCEDETSEWIEVHNTSADLSVDLSGLRLADRALSWPVLTDKVVGPGEFAVFARTYEACGLNQIDGTFGTALSNGGDDVILERSNGESLGGMTYTYAPSGDVWAFDVTGYCHSTIPTPGAPNQGC